MKTNIVIEDINYETSNTTTAKRYISDKGLPIEIIYTDKFLEIIPKDVITNYGFRIPTKKTEERVNSASIVIDMPHSQTLPNEPYEYLGYQQDDVTKDEKKPQNQHSSNSGCLSVIILAVIVIFGLL